MKDTTTTKKAENKDLLKLSTLTLIIFILLTILNSGFSI